MSESTNGQPMEAASQGGGSRPQERVRVRRRVRVRTPAAVRESHRRVREKVFRVLFFVLVGVGSVLMIWFGLKVFVREPAPPRDSGSVLAPVCGERSPV